MARADFLTSIALLLLGIAVVVESWRMPRLENLGVNPYTVPGIVPGLLGGVIALLGSVLLVRSVRAGGWRLAAPGREAARPVRRLALSLALTLGYAAGLVGRLPFWLATLLFVFFFIAVFEYRHGMTARAWLLLVVTSSLQAGVVAAVITAVFQHVFLVQLP